MAYRIGVDIGGTFTDFALFDEVGGRLCVHKQLTTPDDPSRAVLDGIGTLTGNAGLKLDAVESVAHGTTLVTNALIERKGARAGMLVTEGFRDILDMGLERRYDVFDLRLEFPDPLVARRLRREVKERLRYDGTVIEPLDLKGARAAVAELIERERIEALAICFLHSFTNPAHEDAARRLVEAEFPGLFVSTSADIFPNAREFERWTTTTMNAYVQPMADRYLARLESGLAASGFRGRLYIMTSSGGTLEAGAARHYPVRMLESGPAAGALMSARHGRTLSLAQLLSFDMGGTTAKGALVRNGVPLKTYELEVGRVHEFKRGSGLTVHIPVIDMIEIGAGGGSVAEIDSRGLIRVGPRSAGARPGPACYAQGGAAATLTDANLVLGYLGAESFLGGAMALDRPAAERAIMGSVATPLGLDLVRAASGIHAIVNEDVARAFRIHASERGFDYRQCTMVAFGGSGPLHALGIAKKLKISRVVFPMGAGVMSAFGLLVSPLGFETARTKRIALTNLTPAMMAETFTPLIAQTGGFLERANIPAAQITVRLKLDMRYVGQGYEIEVSLPQSTDWTALLSVLPALFRTEYAKTFPLGVLDEPLEILGWKAEALGPEPSLGERLTIEGVGHGAGSTLKSRRLAYFAETGDYVDCPVYDRYALKPGEAITGPALVEERESTAVIGPSDLVRVDAALNLIAELKG
ncbi:MAG: hydantoinase/oxoprolinase family protein [Alphaproteobacteria bacterium]|nr:hydantoinase/oxoprolinase family protein [Alphaproteobacteria bacterium]